MHDTLATLDAPLIDRLRAAIRGRVITPDDPEYDHARTLMMGGTDPRPAAIVRVADASDVAHVVDLARDEHLPLAVRSGGHSGAAHSSVDDGIVIDVRDLDDIEIDVADRSAWAGAGMTAAAFTAAAAEQGLAVGFGDTGSVGVSGITLGGGVGYLGRKFGLTLDSLMAAEIVTADGAIRRIDADTEPDLFWAIRGGGGNFGVVTRFRFRLHEVPSVVGGMLVLPATPATVAGFVAAAEAAPDDVSAIANVMPCPPLPFVATEHHGEVVIFAMVVAATDDPAGMRDVAPFRALAEPLADLMRPMTYPEVYPPEDESYHPLAVSRTMFMDHIGEAEAATILEHLAASDASLRAAQIRVLGGAIARVDRDATAYAHRASRIMVNVACFYESDEDRPRRLAWVEDLARALDQGDDGAYVNFLLDEGEARVRAAYPGPTWDRLVDDQGSLRPDEPVPAQPEHPARGRGCDVTKSAAEKLLIKPGVALWVSPPDRLGLLGELPPAVTTAGAFESAGVAILFVDDAANAHETVEAHHADMASPGILWIAYPKGGRADINRDSLWPMVAVHGLRPITQVAIDDTWSALRFRPLNADEPPFTGGR